MLAHGNGPAPRSPGVHGLSSVPWAWVDRRPDRSHRAGARRAAGNFQYSPLSRRAGPSSGTALRSVSSSEGGCWGGSGRPAGPTATPSGPSQVGIGLAPRFFNLLVNCCPVGVVGKTARKLADELGPGSVPPLQQIHLRPQGTDFLIQLFDGSRHPSCSVVYDIALRGPVNASF